MKVWLDDEPTVAWRAAMFPYPEWTHVRWPHEAIDLIETGTVEVISLDHDLGDKDAAEKEERKERTGYDVARYVEYRLIAGDTSYDPDGRRIPNTSFPFTPPKILSHSQNPPGRERILAAAKQCEHRWEGICQLRECVDGVIKKMMKDKHDAKQIQGDANQGAT